MSEKKSSIVVNARLLVAVAIAITLFISLACNLPLLNANSNNSSGSASSIKSDTDFPSGDNGSNFPVDGNLSDGIGDSVTSSVGVEGETIQAPGDVELIVPPGAFSQPVDINISVGGDLPVLPPGLDIKIAGEIVQVDLPDGVKPDGVFELAIPFQRSGSASDDHYTVLQWDGTQWTDAGGLVEGDRIRVRVNHFSIFAPARVAWMRRPVSFVNDGPYDAAVMPWTYLPLDPSGFLPPGLSTTSFAPGAPGLWPNPSRFLGLPLGTYTFCIWWDEKVDWDGDGYSDVYHYILEGPSADLPLVLTEDAPTEISFATEVRFRTDPINKLEGRCEPSATGQWNVRLLSDDPRNAHPPATVVAYANIDNNPPPGNVTIVSQGNLWRYHEVIALMNEGDWISATCSDQNITTVGVWLVGDTNDGWVRVLVDDQEVWTGSVYGDPDSAQGGFSYYLEISGLEPGKHTIKLENLGIPGDGGGIHVAAYYFVFSTQPMSAP